MVRGLDPDTEGTRFVLNQPITELLSSSDRVLLAGCGGGYDVLGAVPLLLELIGAGKTVSLASLSFTRLDHAPGHHPVPGVPHLFTTSELASEEHYCPEAWLSQWLASKTGRSVPIWCLENVGVLPARRAYEHIVQIERADTVILVDGGIDSLLRGDETSLGTPVEDLVSLAVVDALDIPRKLIACIGFGAELRDGICHAQVLDRIAQLSTMQAWLGVWSLLANTPAGDAYLDAVNFIAAHQAGQKGSHIHSVVSESMKGRFGATAPYVWLSPLASLYWFFALQQVARTNLLLPHIQNCGTLWDVAAVIEGVRKSIAVRKASTIPL